jgi:nucleoid DNA-binding protein
MNKSDLIRAVHEKNGDKMTLKQIDSVVTEMLEIMSERLKAGEEIQLADFGTFALTKFAVKPAEIHTRRTKA